MHQESLFDGPTQLFNHDGRAELHSNLFAHVSAQALREAIDWSLEEVRIFGKWQLAPRMIAYYGDLPYRYSGVEHEARPLPAELDSLRLEAERVSGHAFNSVLCNLYRDGSDSMGYHRDNEPEMDTACIASLSFGASRRFRFKHASGEPSIGVELEHGSLLLMYGCQAEWLHALPKTSRAVGFRINLTFRQLRSLAV